MIGRQLSHTGAFGGIGSAVDLLIVAHMHDSDMVEVERSVKKRKRKREFNVHPTLLTEGFRHLTGGEGVCHSPPFVQTLFTGAPC